MNLHLKLRRACLLLFTGLCHAGANAQSTEAMWQLGWRMFLHAEQKQWALAEREFDTLYHWSAQLDRIFYVQGILVKGQLGKAAEIQKILKERTEAQRWAICESPALHSMPDCSAYAHPPVTHPELQRQLVLCQVQDQYARGSIAHELMKKYGLDSTAFPTMGPIGVDAANRAVLQSILKTTGMPTKAMVGKAGMDAVFLILQHADAVPEWQKEFLPLLKASAESGDFEPQNYAYFYDRVQMNSGHPQRYGTQFKKVDSVRKELELYDTEAPEHLDERRRSVGLMPVSVYQALFLLSFSQ